MNVKSLKIVTACLFASMLVALAWIFRQALAETWASWQTDEYSHGYIVPVVALLFLLNSAGKREEILVQNAIRFSWKAVGVLLAGLMAYAVFTYAGIKGFLPQIFVMCAIALFGVFSGKATLRAAAGPLGLLFFAVPLPKFVYYMLSFNMQMLSTSLGTFVLHGVGIPVFQDGNILDLGSTKLQVAEACNGLRYFFPLVSLGYIFAYLYKAPAWKRAIVFFSTAPIAVLMNGLRIAFIGVTVSFWGQAWAEGIVHDIEGWVVFLGCCLVMLLEVWLLQKLGKGSKGSFELENFRLPSLKTIPPLAMGKPVLAAAFVLILGLSLHAALPSIMLDRLKPVALRHSLTQFPLVIGSWSGMAGTLDEKTLGALGTHDYFIGDYKTAETANLVNLYILYYPAQDVTTNQAVHSPLACIPGGGWRIDGQSSKSVSLKAGGELPVNVLTISKGLERQLVYYLYIQSGTPITEAVVARLANIRNAIFLGKTSGAMIRFVTPIGSVETAETAHSRLDAFLRDTLGTIYEQLGWQL